MNHNFTRGAAFAPPFIRRDLRVQTTIFISVSGFDAAGHFFTEHTATTNVSQRGCCFRLRREIFYGSLLAIQTLECNSDAGSRTALYQIAWMERLTKGATVGAARLHGEGNWYLSTPASLEQQTPKS